MELDVLVVGGGPAGLATAIAARQQGLARVRLVDRRSKPPFDKACGEGLMPDGLAALHALGVEVPPGLGAPFRGIRYVDAESRENPVVAEGYFPEPGPEPGRVSSGGHGLGLRRLDLHRLLVRRAEEAGVELAWGVKALGLGALDEPSRARLETTHGVMAARYLVAADGLLSPLRSWAGLDGRPVTHKGDRRYGVRRHFRLRPWTDLVEVHWGRKAEAYITPVGRDEIGIAFLWSGGSARLPELLSRFPSLERRLAGAKETSRDRGAGPLRQRVVAVTRGRLALVGDASGYVDAITGEGLSLAFHQSLALASAMAAGDLGTYARDHRSIGRLPDALTRLMLGIERRPWLRRRVLRALAAEPQLFHRLLGVHSRALPFGQLVRQTGIGGALRLARRLALA